MRKKSLVVLALTVLVALAATSVHAQTFTVRANIPFDFYAGSSAMPAGEYTFDTLMGHGIGHIWSADSIRNVTVLFQPSMLPSGFDGGSASLVFHRYDKTYFLSEVRNGVESADCVIPASSSELKIQKSASLRGPDEEVVVLARR